MRSLLLLVYPRETRRRCHQHSKSHGAGILAVCCGTRATLHHTRVLAMPMNGHVPRLQVAIEAARRGGVCSCHCMAGREGGEARAAMRRSSGAGAWCCGWCGGSAPTALCASAATTFSASSSMGMAPQGVGGFKKRRTLFSPGGKSWLKTTTAWAFLY